MRFSCWCIEDVRPLACAGTNTRGRRRSDVCRKSVIRAVTVDVACWAGKRPATPSSHFGLFRHLEFVIYLDPEISDCALELGAPRPQLEASRDVR
jgi:hypothetical protein